MARSALPIRFNFPFLVSGVERCVGSHYYIRKSVFYLFSREEGGGRREEGGGRREEGGGRREEGGRWE